MMNLPYWLFIIGSVCAIIAVILMGLIGTRLDREIATLRQGVNMYEFKRDSMIQNQHNFQLWESRGMNLRDNILLLEAVNIILKNPNIENTIRTREEEMLESKYHSIASYSANLNYSNEEINSWKYLNFEELEKQKYEVANNYKKNFDETLESINTIKQHIKNAEKEKARFLYITLAFQVIGLVLILYSRI